MGADPGILSLVVKFVADASQLVANMKRAETATVESTEKMTQAQRLLNAEQQRAGDLQSKFDAEMLRDAEVRKRLIETTREQAAAEKSAADAASLNASAMRVEEMRIEAINSLLADQKMRLRELQSEERGRNEVAAVAQAWEEKRAAALIKSAAAFQQQSTAVAAAAVVNKEYEFSVRSMFPVLVNLRTLARVATGILAIGFIISEWEAFQKALEGAALAMGGFGAEAQKAYEADIKASQEAYIHFTSIAEGYRRIREQLAITAQAEEAGIMRMRAMGVASADLTHWWLAALGPLGNLTRGIWNYHTALAAVDKTQTDARTTLDKLLEQMKKLQDEQQKEAVQNEKNADADEKRFEAQEKQEEAAARKEQAAYERKERQELHAAEVQQRFVQESLVQIEKWAQAWEKLQKAEDAALGITFAHSATEGIALWKRTDEAIASVALHATELNKALGGMTNSFHALSAAQRDLLPLSKEMLEVQTKFAKEEEKEQIQIDHMEKPLTDHIHAIRENIVAIKDRTKAIEKEVQAELDQQHARIGAGITLEDYQKMEIQGAAAVTTAKKAQKAAEEDAAAGAIAGFIGMIAGRRAQAAVEAAYDGAKAVEMWAAYAESDFTNGAKLAAAIEYTVAAAEMGYAAGRGGGGGGRGGSGGSGGGGQTSGRRYGPNASGGGGGDSSSPGTVMGQSGGSSGGSSGGHSITQINVSGGMISADTLQQFMAKVGVGQGSGMFRINANTTSSVPAPRA